jgi:hypothetical protein
MTTKAQRAIYSKAARERNAGRRKLVQFGTEQAGNGIHCPPLSKHLGIKVTTHGPCRACRQPLHLSPWDGGMIPNCRNLNCGKYRQPVDKFTK